MRSLIAILLGALLAAGCGGGGSPVDPCEGVDCSGHGTCNVVSAEARCTCEFGYKLSEDGKECLLDDTNPCAPYDCSGHGTCTLDAQDQPTCVCHTGYWHTPDGLDCVENSCTQDCGAIGCCGSQCCTVRPSNWSSFGRLETTGITRTASGSFDTDTDCAAGSALGDCETVALAGAPDACVCRLDQLTVTGTLTLTGPRVLAVLAWTSIRVDGTLDLSARRDRPGAGSEEPPAATSWLGGAGGSLGTLGGGGTARGNPQLVPLLGGQDGADGCGERLGGGGGGGVQLTAGESITVAGSIQANGGGGQGGAAGERPDKCSGGAGGGSGGGILLEAKTVSVGGAIWAHGGGGGGGGNDMGATGGDGQDATCSMTPAPGGAGRDGASCALYGAIDGGNGGAGAVGDNPGEAGEAPAENQCPDPPQPFVGGGGGGGGSGRIRINTLTGCGCTGTISPPHATGVVQGR